VTTGYLVRFLAKNTKAFDDVTHLIIDEVHERSIDSDILCSLARRLLKTHPRIRLVLMSVTVAAFFTKITLEWMNLQYLQGLVVIRLMNTFLKILRPS